MKKTDPRRSRLMRFVTRFIPMQSSIKSILIDVVVIAVVLWFLNVFGLFHSLSRMHVLVGLTGAASREAVPS
jgi:hypothetical protein